MQNSLSQKLKVTLISVVLAFVGIIVFGLIWFFFLGPSAPVGLGWYVFSFAAGLTMIVLPCTLPLAFVIVPLSMGKGAAKGIGIALSFGLGVALMLSLYGVIAAWIGEVAIGTLGAPLEVVKNWLYFAAGTFAFFFALGEIGLLRVRMPTYKGSAPAFIQKQSDFIKAFLLGLFLGNVGVGCPHPATPVILTRIAASGDIFYGWLLFFVHAAGRVLPLLLLAFLGILGVNALAWIVKRKDAVERATGWGMVFVAGFILVLGLFTHAWWVQSGQHTLLEDVTGEQYFLGVIINRFGLAVPSHSHGAQELLGQTGLFGMPLWVGNWVLIALWILPMWWHYIKRRKKVEESPSPSALPESGEDGMAQNGEEQKIEKRILSWRFWLTVALSVLLVITFALYLPTRFLYHVSLGHTMSSNGTMMGTAPEHENKLVINQEEGAITNGLAVNFNITPVPVLIGTSTRLDFFVNTKPGNVPVPTDDLEIEHTKLMHVIGVRDDMEEFFHIHPQPTSTPGILTLDYIFKKPGRYKIWSEIKKDEVNYAFGHPEISVQGAGEPYDKQVSFVTSYEIGDYQAVIHYGVPLVKNEATVIYFEIHDRSGRDVELADYLGAKMHLTIIKDDWKQFIHTHPSENHGNDHAMMHTDSLVPFIDEARAHGEEEIINDAHNDAMTSTHGIPFSVVFPEAGIYRAFAQFVPAEVGLPPDESLIASFWVNVEDAGTFRPSKPLLVGSSLALIVLLSWAVKKFLIVDSQ